MAKVTTIAECLDMADGEQPLIIKAKLVSVGKRRAGQSNGRDYSFEDVEFMDATGKMRGSFANREPADKSLIGEVLLMEATKGPKGWSGLYVKEESFTPQGSDEEVTVKKLRVTATARVRPAADADDEDCGREPHQEQEKPKPIKKAQPVEDDVPMDDPPPKQQQRAAAPVKSSDATACRCKEVRYERVANLGNYNSERVGIVLELEPGAKFQDCLDLARMMVEKNLTPDAVTKV